MRSDPKLPDIHSSTVSSFAFNISAEGVPTQIDLMELKERPSDQTAKGYTWVHLKRDAPETLPWLNQAGLDQIVIDALIADETRPRCTAHSDGALLILRGVNLTSGAKPEDMISIRLWIKGNRVITVTRRPLSAVRDLTDEIAQNRAPRSPGAFVAKLALRLADRAEPIVAELNEELDTLEVSAMNPIQQLSRGALAEVRRTAIVLRRYMIPQKDALTTLQIEDFDWFDEKSLNRLNEAIERVTRLGEDLDSIRDRAQVVHDQIIDQRAETMNRQMYILAVVAAMFLPLGLLTGLLGINVGGMPGMDNPWAFEIVCGILVLVGLLQYVIFRRLGLF